MFEELVFGGVLMERTPRSPYNRNMQMIMC